MRPKHRLASKSLDFRLSSDRIGGIKCAAQAAWPKTRRRGVFVPNAGRCCRRLVRPAGSRMSRQRGSAAAAVTRSGRLLLRRRQPRHPHLAPIVPSGGSSQSCSATWWPQRRWPSTEVLLHHTRRGGQGTLIREPGLHMTRRWREPDSNPRFPYDQRCFRDCLRDASCGNPPRPIGSLPALPPGDHDQAHADRHG